MVVRAASATALILGYPYLVYRGMGSGLVWVAPFLVSILYFYRAFGARNLEARLLNILVGVTLIFAVVFLKDLSAKLLPVLVQLICCWFFGRTLLTGPSLIERFVRLEYPVVPPGIIEYCRLLTWIWTFFFAVNVLVCAALALWASDAWWAFYTGVVIIGATGCLLAGEYFYRRYRFPGLNVPDPESSFKSIWLNGWKIWMDVHVR